MEFKTNLIPYQYHHLSVMTCKEPGVMAANKDQSAVWNCQLVDHVGVDPQFPSAPICAHWEDVGYFNTLLYRSHGMDLTLPPGVGFKVGPDTGYEYIVLVTHYPDHRNLTGGRTGKSEIRVRLQRDDGHMRSAGTLDLNSWGYADPGKEGRLRRSFVTDEPVVMHPLSIHIHTHALGYRVELWHTRRQDGKSTLIGSGNPQVDTLYIPVDSRITIHPGDRLTFSCFYNITETLKVEYEPNLLFTANHLFIHCILATLRCVMFCLTTSRMDQKHWTRLPFGQLIQKSWRTFHTKTSTTRRVSFWTTLSIDANIGDDYCSTYSAG